MNTKGYRGILLKYLKCFIFDKYFSQLLPYSAPINNSKKISGLKRKKIVSYSLFMRAVDWLCFA